MHYQPAPLDTTAVTLPTEVEQLIERLARNTHEVWAQRRMEEGWKWGPHRDDARREHPGLVEYEALSEEEKDYDRATAREAIKTILLLGYRLIPAATTGGSPT